MEMMLMIKVGFCGLALVGCGYLLGRDKGVKIGAGKMIDDLIMGGYLKWRGSKENPTILKYDE